MHSSSSVRACYKSPLGTLGIEANNDSLTAIRFGNEDIDSKPDQSNHRIIQQTIQQLDEYFDGQRTVFDLPLAPSGTDFQQTVWEQLQQIPFGQTITYGELAEILGDWKKVRAVGTANGQNPIPIIIPCHRVIGANNKLVGYAGGIHRKKQLLQHEGALLL